MKIIAFANQKGGVGKTTSVLNCGAALANSGKNVLLVDMDPQAHLTMGLGMDANELDHTIYELLKKESKLKECLIRFNQIQKDFSLLPSSIRLSGAESEFSALPGREYLLKDSFAELKEPFDYVLLDCPPSLGILTINAFVAASEVYIPLQCEFLALHGMHNLLQVISIVKERLNPELEITGIIGTMFDGRKSLNKEVLAKIEEHFGDKLFKTLIRGNVSLAEAPSYGLDIFNYKPNSVGARDYLNLSEEIMKRS